MNRTPAPKRSRALRPIPRVEGIDYGEFDRTLGYALRRADIEMLVAFHIATRGMDITPPRYTALSIIGANPGITQSTLGAVLGIARSGAMLLTDWMEDRGLAGRRRRDGRTWGLHLTARGTRLVRRASRRIAEEDRRRASVLSVRERSTLLRLLAKLVG